MPQNTSDQQLAEALLQSVQHGSYPESEEVVSAELLPSAFQIASGLLEDARKEVKDDLRQLSWESASDVDDWLVQARQLLEDVDQSKHTASEILRHAEEEKALQMEVTDVANKRNLLNAEVAFNESLVETLGLMQRANHQIDIAEEVAVANELLEATRHLVEAEDILDSIRNFESTNVVLLSRQRIDELRNDIRETVESRWDSFVSIDSTQHSITLRQNANVQVADDTLSDVRALESLGMLSKKVDALYHQLNTEIIRPRLEVQADNTVASISIKGDKIFASGKSSDLSVRKLFDDLSLILNYLALQLPKDIALPLSQTLVPSLASTLLSTWLASSVPSSLDEMAQFSQVLSMVEEFVRKIGSLGWAGTSQLTDWVQNAPRVWLSQRRETMLQHVRFILSGGLGKTRTVERVETQKISRDDDILTGTTQSDWDANWSDDGSEKPVDGVSRGTGHDEEDVSAWGFDEDDQPTSAPEMEQQEKPTHDGEEDDEAGDAWGWGDENNDSASAPPSPQKSRAHRQNTNGQAEPSSDAREMTLKESLTLTAIPDALLDLVQKITSDYEQLSEAGSGDSPVALAAPGLTSLPTLLFAFYRASASLHYSQHPSGNMFLYNDSLWLADQLRQLGDRDQSTGTAQTLRRGGRFNFEPDIKSLDLCGKRAYAKEMESQRTIIGDLLDGAQGFASCTEEPFASACEEAVSSTTERIRVISEQWNGVLSHSALLQSLGSLLSHASNKIIFDLEDMSDISEPESQRLAQLCAELSKLEDLFMPKPTTAGSHDTPQTALPLTAVYTPNWLKFQYLANILESSLVDIKYLWSEGEMSLEFSADEVVDLIEALFADSEHRRKAIAEIRRR